jgi:hypothetical protein
MDALQAAGPRAAPATPTLMGRLERTNSRTEQLSILRTLRAIGPAAGSVAGPLEKWAEATWNRDPDLADIALWTAAQLRK